jgi:hypothetical protein
MTKINWMRAAVFGGVVLLVFLIGIGALLFLWQRYGYGGWGPGGMMGGRGPGMMGYGRGGGVLSWLFSLPSLFLPLGFLVLLVLGGAWLFWQVGSPRVPSAGPPQTRPGQTCPSCDRAIEADWKLCPYCGQGLV